MMEFGLPLRGQQQANCMNAVYDYFAPRWGKFKEDGFSSIPKGLKSLKPTLVRKNKFLGGLYDLDLRVKWEVSYHEKWAISLKNRLGAKREFTTKSNSALALSLVEKLNSDTKLMQALLKIDLVGISVELKEHCLELNVTPLGGGICYIVIPPVRYICPLPREQRNMLAWSMENIAKKISSTALS